MTEHYCHWYQKEHLHLLDSEIKVVKQGLGKAFGISGAGNIMPLHKGPSPLFNLHPMMYAMVQRQN